MPPPPSALGAAAGAEILLNLSASNIVIGKAQMRRLLCASQSARCIAAYAYSAAGVGESTTDLAWDGQAGIFEIGESLCETRALQRRPRDRDRRYRCRPHPPGAHAHQHVRRQCAAAAGPERHRRSAGSNSTSRRRPAGSTLQAHGRALPVRALGPGDAARQLLRGLQHPGAGPGAAARSRPASSSS